MGITDDELDRRLRELGDALGTMIAGELDDPEQQARFLDAVDRADAATAEERQGP